MMQKMLNGCGLRELFGSTFLIWCTDPFLWVELVFLERILDVKEIFQNTLGRKRDVA